MVRIVFKTVCLFLALFALPQVLAAPDTAPYSPTNSGRPPLPTSIVIEALGRHNAIRRSVGVPGVAWSGNLVALANVQTAACNDEKLEGVAENLSTASTFAAAFDGWVAGGPQRDQIILETIKEIGCSVSDCPNFRLSVCVYS